MINPSNINETVRAYIREKLNALAKQQGIRILLAIESGSRGWGFPSQDSDYDVRFIYVHEMDKYLSIESFGDVIETPLVNDPKLGVVFDLNGWDIRKAFQLAIKSNATLMEWLTSPVRYVEGKAVVMELHKFFTSCASLTDFAYHYDRLARNAWKQIVESNESQN